MAVDESGIQDTCGKFHEWR